MFSSIVFTELLFLSLGGSAVRIRGAVFSVSVFVNKGILTGNIATPVTFHNDLCTECHEATLVPYSGFRVAQSPFLPYSYQHQFSSGTFCRCEFSQENFSFMFVFLICVVLHGYFPLQKYEPDKKTPHFVLMSQNKEHLQCEAVSYCSASGAETLISVPFDLVISFLSCYPKKNNTNILVIPI